MNTLSAASSLAKRSAVETTKKKKKKLVLLLLLKTNWIIILLLVLKLFSKYQKFFFFKIEFSIFRLLAGASALPAPYSVPYAAYMSPAPYSMCECVIVAKTKVGVCYRCENECRNKTKKKKKCLLIVYFGTQYLWFVRFAIEKSIANRHLFIFFLQIFFSKKKNGFTIVRIVNLALHVWQRKHLHCMANKKQNKKINKNGINERVVDHAYVLWMMLLPLAPSTINFSTKKKQNFLQIAPFFFSSVPVA